MSAPRAVKRLSVSIPTTHSRTCCGKQEQKQNRCLRGDDLPVTHGTHDDIPTPLLNHARYEIEQLCGRGGMGRVYKARHRMMDRTVALKVIHGEWVRNREAIDRFPARGEDCRKSRPSKHCDGL